MKGPFSVEFYGGERTGVFDSNVELICVAESEVLAYMICAALNAVWYTKEASKNA